MHSSLGPRPSPARRHRKGLTALLLFAVIAFISAPQGLAGILVSPAPASAERAAGLDQRRPSPAAPTLDSVLYDQYSNPSFLGSPSFVGSIVSQVADDFVVPSGELWQISSVDVDGFYDANTSTSSVNVFFYTNVAGPPALPGSPVLERLNVTPETGLSNGDFGLPISPTLALTAGNYWVSVQANNPTGRWLWVDRLPPPANNLAAVRQPGGPNPVCEEWNLRQVCVAGTEGDPDQVFRLRGVKSTVATNTATATAIATGTASATITPGGPSLTPTASATSTAFVSATGTPMGTPSGTATSITSSTSTRTSTATTVVSRTATAVPSSTSTSATTATITATMEPTTCTIQFQDVPASNDDSSFYPYVRCLACRGVLSGYPCGGTNPQTGDAEPCGRSGNPYFRPGNYITRGQIAKIVSNAAGFNEAVEGQTYADVPPSDEPSSFYAFIERLTAHNVMSGYRCGANADEECDEQARAYFRPSANATRAQLAKIVSNAAGLVNEVEGQTFADVPPPAQEGDPSSFYLFVERLAQRGVIGGYPCGGPGEKCDGENRPFFRPGSSVTRGQAAKIVANTFFPNCQTYPTTLTCDTSGDRNGESTPSAGRVDDILTFTARGFAPGENVGYWFTTPDGQVFGTDTPSDGFTSSEEGTVGPIRLRIPAEFVEAGTGQWTVTFQGEQSNNLAVIHFCIYP